MHCGEQTVCEFCLLDLAVYGPEKLFSTTCNCWDTHFHSAYQRAITGLSVGQSSAQLLLPRAPHSELYYIYVIRDVIFVVVFEKISKRPFCDEMESGFSTPVTKSEG